MRDKRKIAAALARAHRLKAQELELDLLDRRLRAEFEEQEERKKLAKARLRELGLLA